MNIQPFTIDISQTDIDDLHDRLAHTRWPGETPGTGWERGVPLDYLKGLAEYWRSGFDWRAQEARLNEFPQFTTQIDGQTIHFLHVRSPEPDALPLIISHGWPGSIVEFMKIIDPLTNPRAYGGDPADAFHVVAPSLPGFVFSTPVRETGWQTLRIAGAFAELMDGLGYQRYGAQGGDIGSGVSGELGQLHPERVVGIHVNTDPMATAALVAFGNAAGLSDLSEEDKSRIEELRRSQADGSGYFQIQSTRPQTLGYGLTDSPAGQLAWIVEKFKAWTDPSAALPDDAVDRDQLLTNISLYWFTRSGISSAHFYYEASHSGRSWVTRSSVPQGWAVFGRDDLLRRLVDPDHTFAHWSEFEHGRHFPAMEAPDLLVDDIRAFFRSLRANI